VMVVQLRNRTFLVTGGGSGLGAATVELFRVSGANVVILDVNEEAGANVARRTGALFVPTDVTREDSVKNAIEQAVSTYGGVHGAINCAGIGTAAKVLGKKGVHPLELFERTVQINLVGTFNVIRLAAEVMVQQEPNEEGERGVFVNTASVAAFDGQIGQAAYSASKAGIVGMTLPIARELAEYGIRVAAVAPGIFDTPMLAGLPEPARESLGRQVPFPSRLGRPSEYAALVKHIVENPMLNGEVIRLDGALRMAPR
jgi:NAD(P)-dependent dehydrogenase (short-subunit alcohol dehydrogenase family)